jgi:alpha-D-ribose 1-methylphosphonate 5-triphosphate diphosphatase
MPEHGITSHLQVRGFPVGDVTHDAADVAAHDGPVLVSVDASGLTASADSDDPELEWFTVQALAQRVRLVVHGPATADDIDRAVDWGAGAVENPTTIEAARRAHERGLAVIGSAADIVSISGAPTAISPLALIELGLCDALSSADQTASLLDAVSLLVLRGICDLRSAVELGTSAPARIAGRNDRGRLVSGQRGDLVLVRPDREHFRVRAVIRAGEPAPIAGTLVG